MNVVLLHGVPKPSHTYYVRYPAGWRDYLRRKHGEPPYGPGDFYLCVDKNVYGREESGLIWFQMLSLTVSSSRTSWTSASCQSTAACFACHARSTAS